MRAQAKPSSSTLQRQPVGHVRRVLLSIAGVSLGVLAAGCGNTSESGEASGNQSVDATSVDTVSDEGADPTTTIESTAGVSGELPTVVVTYSALESIVAEIVGGLARVEVVVPNGTDPHDFEPSAKDVESMSTAAIVVANGLDLEEGLEDALEEVEGSGVAVFRITDHVTLRDGAGDGHSHGDDHSDGEDLGSEARDPHVWLDPLTLAEAVPALAEAIGRQIKADLLVDGAAVVASLKELSAAIDGRIKTLDSCVVITGHDSLGYFGARYGCEVLGSIIPSFSTAAEATAKDLAELKTLAKAEGVKAVFTELGTPAEVAEQLAKEVGVEVLDIATHLVPDDGGYGEMMLALTDVIVRGLS